MSRYLRALLLLILMLSFSACDDDVSEMSDDSFHDFTFGKTEAQAAVDNSNAIEPTSIKDVKKDFPKYTKEFVWHKKGDAANPSYRNEVILFYNTRNGQFYLHFVDNKLIAKRKIQVSG